MGQTFEEFREAMKKEVERLLGKEIMITATNTMKNNGTIKRGLVVTEKGEETSMILYLESAYECYKKGASLKKLARELWEDYEKSRENPKKIAQNLGRIGQFDEIKNRVVYRLVNYERNRELLNQVPYIPFCNLAVVFYLMVEAGEECQAAALIQNQQVKAWGTDTSALFKLAAENTPRILPAEIRSMEDVMREIAETCPGDGKEDLEAVLSVPNPRPLYVAGNNSGLHGAAVVLYDGVLRNFAESVEKDLVILPSSIHEVLLIPVAPTLDLEYLEDIVRHINQGEVPEEEVLSDQVYLYKRETDQVCMAM